MRRLNWELYEYLHDAYDEVQVAIEQEDDVGCREVACPKIMDLVIQGKTVIPEEQDYLVVCEEKDSVGCLERTSSAYATVVPNHASKFK